MKRFFFNLFSIIRSLFMVTMNIFNKRETVKYPYVLLKLPYRYRGKIILTKDSNGNERCVACGLCAVVCPVSCIELQKTEDINGRWYPKIFKINFARCIFCGLCEEACPTLALQLTTEINMHEYNRSELIYEKERLLVNNTGKYSKYNFYKQSGKFLSSLEDKNFVNVKDILP